MTKIEKVIYELQYDFLSHVGTDEYIKSLMPLVKPKEINCLIYNLFVDKKYLTQLSHKEINNILDILIERRLNIKTNNKND